jgi:hypothetical protein
VPLQLRGARAPGADADEARVQLVEEARLADAGLALDEEHGERSLQRLPGRALERLQLGGAAQQDYRAAAGFLARTHDRSRDEQANIVLAEDGRLERARLGRRLEP